MQTNQTGPDYRFDAPVPPGRTLNDYRVIPEDLNAPAPASRSLAGIIGVVAIVGGASLAAWYYNDHRALNGNDTVAAVTTPATTDPSVPPASSAVAPATEGTTAQDSAATAPLAPVTKQSEATAMPEALHGNNHSSDAVGTARNPESSSPRAAPAPKRAGTAPRGTGRTGAGAGLYRARDRTGTGPAKRPGADTP